MSKIRTASPADARAIAEVHVASWKTTYRGLVPDDYLEGLTPEKRLSQWERNLAGIAAGDSSKQTFVAEVDSRVVGFVVGGKPQEPLQDFDCELYAVYLYQEWQGQGLGAALFGEMIQWLHRLGRQKMFVWVVEGNPACSFYQRMGGVEVGKKTVEIGGKPLIEIAYGYELR